MEREIGFWKILSGGMSNYSLSGGDNKNLGDNFAGVDGWLKMFRLKFWLINAFSSNWNSVNLKSFPKNGGTYTFKRKIDKYSEGIDKDLKVYRSILEIPELQHLIHPRLLAKFGTLVLFILFYFIHHLFGYPLFTMVLHPKKKLNFIHKYIKS